VSGLTAGAGIAALWLGAGSAWAQAEPVAESPEQVRSRVQAVCAPYEAGVPADLDLQRTQSEVDRLQQNRLSGHLELACQGWWAAVRRFRADSIAAIRFQATIAASLLWVGRSGDAFPILLATREQLMPLAEVGRLEVASLSGMIGGFYTFRRDIPRAVAELERAMQEQASDPDPSARELRWTIAQNFGAILMAARQYDRSEKVLTGLLAEIESASPKPNPLLKAWVLSGLVNLEFRREQYAKALNYSRVEVAWLEALGEVKGPELLMARQNLSLTLARLGIYDEAEAVMRAAIATTFDAVSDYQNNSTDLRESLAELLLQRGRPLEAAQALREALALIEASQVKGSAREMNSRRLLARAYAALGDLGAAVEQYRVIETWIDSGGRGGEALHRIGSLSGFARVLIELGDYEEARSVLGRAQAELAKAPAQRKEQAEVLRLSARLKQAGGDMPGLLADLSQAAQVLAPTYPDVSPEQVELKVLACPADTAACAALLQALEDSGRDTDHPALPHDLEARGRLALGARARESSQPASATRLAHAALVAAVRSGSPALLGLAYGLQADVRADAGRFDEAIFFGKLALAEVQRQRARVVALGAAAEAHFLERRSEVYRSLADRLAGQGRIAEALAVLRLAKRAEQADWGQRGAGALDDEQVAELLPWSPAERRLQQQLAQTLASHQALADEYARLRRLDAARAITADEQARLATLAQQGRQEREQLQAQLDALLQTVAAVTAPAPHPRQGAAAAGASDAAERAALARVRPREAGVVHAWLMLSPQGLRSVVVGRERSWVRARRVAPQEVSRDIARWLEALRRPGAGASGRDELGARLYERIGRLVDEPARQARANRVVLWLDGPLRHLPLAALHDGRQYLAQKYTLLHAAPVLDGAVQGPTARRSAGRGATVPSLLQAFGMTEAAAGLPALPGVARELCGIVRGPVQGLATDAAATAVSGCTDGGTRGQGPVAGEAVANAQFTATRLQQALAAPAVDHAAASRLLHIGTHFVLRPGHVERSWLLLGDGQRLGLREVARLDLRGQQLVTLSACETGAPAGDATDGRQIDGLAAAVLGAGARQVLASLWRVDDQATARFMRVFYEESRRAGSPAQGTDWAAALQRTQQRLLAGGGSAARPHDWAAFVLMDARP